MKKYIRLTAGVSVVKIISSVISIIGLAGIPFITKSMIDNSLSVGFEKIWVYILLYLAAISVTLGFEYINQYHSWKLDQKFNILIKQDIVDKVFRLSYTSFKERSKASYISYLQNDVEVIANQFLYAIVTIITTLLQVVVYAAYMFALDWRIAVLILGLAVLSLIPPKITGKRLAAHKKEHLESIDRYLGVVDDLFEGFKNVSASTRPFLSKHHRNFLLFMENTMMKYGRFSTFTNVLNGWYAYLMQLAAFSLGGYLLYRHQITAGVVMAALGYVESICFPLRDIMENTNALKASKAARDRVTEFLNMEEEGERTTLTEFHDSIRFENVAVTYGEFRFGPFDYVFRKGRKYALVGQSGVGKSTILNFLMKYASPDQGSITIDGMDMGETDTAQLMCCIRQKEHIYHDSFRNNVTLFDTYPLTDRVEITAIRQMKERLWQAEDCSVFSGGEGQMLAMVRMLLQNCEIILLDEAFSALDPKSREVLQKCILGMPGKTVIAVTHDLSEETLGYFDEVIELS